MTKLFMLMLFFGLIGCSSSDNQSDSKENGSSDDVQQEQSTESLAPENETENIPVGSVLFWGTPESAVSQNETSVTVTVNKVIGYGSQIPTLKKGEKSFIVPEGALSVRAKLATEVTEQVKFMALYRENLSGATWTLQEVVE